MSQNSLAWAALALSCLLPACSPTDSDPEKQYTGPCRLDEQIIGGSCYPTAQAVRLDSVGFLPGRRKAMTIASAAAGYKIRRLDGTVVRDAKPDGALFSDDTQETDLVEGVFTSLTDPGDYFVEVPGVGVSPPFHVGADAYDGAFKALMLGMYGWRCGTGVSFRYGDTAFGHAACHMADGYLDYAGGQHTQKDGKGGWHDAGDYGKYVINAGVSVGTMLDAWLHFKPSLEKLTLAVPEHGGAVPDYLAEVKWELDWLLKMQFDGGAVSHKLTAVNFESFIMPEADASVRYFTPLVTPATAYVAAVMAMAARIYAPYDAAFADRCKTAALLSYQYLQANPDLSEPNANDPKYGFQTGAYTVGRNGDTEARLWAASEIWETTGDPAALADLEARIQARSSRGLVEANMDWGNTQTIGLYTYLASKKDGRNPDLIRTVAESALAVATGLSNTSAQHAYGRDLGSSYWWGANGTIARSTLTLQMAYRLTGDPGYLDAAVRQIDHLFGRNYYGRSFVTGVGFRPPVHPHHRPSGASGHTWPGLLVGGPDGVVGNKNVNDGRVWQDLQASYTTNEVCLNWNTGLIYALAGFLSDSQDGTAWIQGGLIDAGLRLPDAGGADSAAPDTSLDAPMEATPDVSGAEGGSDADDEGDAWAVPD